MYQTTLEHDTIPNGHVLLGIFQDCKELKSAGKNQSNMATQSRIQDYNKC